MTNCFSEFSAVHLDYCPEYLISKKGLSHQTNLVRQPHKLTLFYISGFYSSHALATASATMSAAPG